jgi:hypothetical protein
MKRNHRRRAGLEVPLAEVRLSEDLAVDHKSVDRWLTTRETIDLDFARSPRIHACWRIR